MAQTFANLLTHIVFSAQDRVPAFFEKNHIAYDERSIWQ